MWRPIWAISLLGAACIAGGTGCQAPPQPTGPTVERVSVTQPDDRNQLWNAVCDTLRDQSFRLDRQDKVNGVITTHPETTAQSFELWRPQPQPAYYWVEANFQTIARQTTVQLVSDERTNQTSIDVKVERLRYRLEERQIDNPAGAMRLYSADAPTVSGQSSKINKSSFWYLIGRDEQMERSLLNAMLKTYMKRTGNTPSESTTQPADTQPSAKQ